MRKGILAGITAYTLWGVFPVYWKLLEAVPALEILAHRMIWSLIFVAGVLVLRGDLRWIREALRRRRLVGTYLLAAVLLSLNWFTYIWAVNHDFIVESSLGYFITPLVNVLFGVVFLKERLRPQQAMAVGLAVIGVLYLTVNYGSLPWIALALAVTFSLYGLIKKTAPLSSMHGFTLETLAMFLPALAYLTWREAAGSGAFGHQGTLTTLLLALAGPVTAIPLLLFGAAARRIPLSMLGFLQYISPTLQFLLGVVVYREPFPPARLVGFVIIWTALVVYTAEGVMVRRKRIGG
jgi:chloramphenicol-sensitive protein RarD